MQKAHLFLSLFKPLVSQEKTPNFHKGMERRATSLLTCPKNDLGIGHDPCGQSHGSGPDDQIQSGTYRPLPFALPLASKDHLA